MAVSSTFFGAVKNYSDVQLERTLGNTWVPSREWERHPLNWNYLKKLNGEISYTNGDAAGAFFDSLLRPLEAHFDNCQEVLPKNKYTWICPSKYDSDDVLTLHVHPDTLGFESKSKGSGKCWINQKEHGEDRFDRSPGFSCEAWNVLNGTDHLLQFKVRVFASGAYPIVTEYDNNGEAIDETGRLGLGFMKPTPGPLDQSSFKRFLATSENLETWQRYHHGLVEAFAAATASNPASPPVIQPPSPPTPESVVPTPVECPKFDPTSCPTPVPLECPKPESASPTPIPVECPKPEPTDCPPRTDANANGSEQKSSFAFGLISGLIGTITAVSAILLSRSQKKTEHPS